MKAAVSILVGAVCGVLSGFGIGGGSLLMVWMTAVMAMEQAAARSINLLYFLPTAAAALIFHFKNGQICKAALVPAILFGCAASVGGALLAQAASPGISKKVFGCFLIFVGLRELLQKKNRSRASARNDAAVFL